MDAKNEAHEQAAHEQAAREISVRAAKASLRGVMQARRGALSGTERAAASVAICARLLDLPLPIFASGRGAPRGAVAVYLATPDEADVDEAVRALLARDVPVVAPLLTPGAPDKVAFRRLRSLNEVQSGPLAVRQPVARSETERSETEQSETTGASAFAGSGSMDVGEGALAALTPPAQRAPASPKLGRGVPSLRGGVRARVQQHQLSHYPFAEADIAVFFVPGVAFDRGGARLGRGAGWYDRALARAAENGAPAIGVCFDCQLVESVPCEPHDRRVSIIVTPTQTIEVERRALDAASAGRGAQNQRGAIDASGERTPNLKR